VVIGRMNLIARIILRNYVEWVRFVVGLAKCAPKKMSYDGIADFLNDTDAEKSNCRFNNMDYFLRG